jgi:exodeoxyribonuclease VII large subunit
VGLVTSLGSDAYQDVLRTLQESGLAFRVVAHGARVQGGLTEPSVLNALDQLRAHAAELDVVLICRGGGSRTDLAWLDSEPIARAVATFPLPVVVGIGHETDVSVLDLVGFRAKTPTAAAALLVERVLEGHRALEARLAEILVRGRQILHDESREARGRARQLARAAQALLGRASETLSQQRRRAAQGTRARLGGAETDLSRRAARVPRAALLLVERRASRLEEGVRQLRQGTTRDLSAASRRLDDTASLLGPRAARRLALEAERVEARGRRLRLLDPRRVVERGYAILRSDRGGVITDAARAPQGTTLTAELKQGVLRLRSEGPEEEQGHGKAQAPDEGSR